MPIFESIVERWQRENQERIEKNRIFDVEERAEELVLLKRKNPVLKRAIAIFLFAIFWLFVCWIVFRSPVNQDVWIGWVILCSLIAPVMAIPFVYAGWLVVRGDIWAFNSQQCRLKHNGKNVCPLSEIEYIRVQEYYGVNDIKYFCVVVVRRQGKQIVLADYGYGNENKKELISVAQLITEFIGLPTKIQISHCS